MINNAYQLTIRGIDAETKKLLAQQASQKGVSMNKLALTTLRQAVGTDTSEERYRRVAAILDKNPMPADEVAHLKNSLQQHKKASLAKQKKDER